MNNSILLTPWLVRHRATPQALVRLFCFPYAGGAAHIFRSWPASLPPFVDVYAVQPPGRGFRMLSILARKLARTLNRGENPTGWRKSPGANAASQRGATPNSNGFGLGLKCRFE